MKRFVVTFVACFLAVIFAAVIPILVIAGKASQPPKVKKGSWLVLHLEGPLPEYPATAMLPPPLGGQEMSLTDVLEALEKAKVDDRIEGVLVRLGGLGAGAATHEEIRNAIHRYRTGGKKIYAWGEYIDRSSYLIASACDSIFMLPTGGLRWTGAAAITPRAKRMFEKLDIKPDIDQIERYKSAAELVTREDMSPEAREETTRLLTTMHEVILGVVARERGLSPADVESAMVQALFSAEEAKAARFVDALEYWQTIEDRLKGKDEKLKTIGLTKYAEIERGSVGLKGKKKIGVVHAIGLIGGRHSGMNPLLGRTMGSDTVVGDLKRAMEDDDVAAVIFRVDSNGGESVTSDLIGHQVERVKSKKPIVVSMVDVAASGGYSIAYRGSAILADTTTVTGSIGSISGKFNARGLYAKLGITFDAVAVGPNALFWSGVDDWTDEQRAIHHKDHWASYNQWIADIARARGLTAAEVDSVGRGRVWLGPEAVERKLIDGLGDFDAAVARAKELAGVDADAKVSLVHYPARKNFFEALVSGGMPEAIDLLLDRWAAARIGEIREAMSEPLSWQVLQPIEN